VLDFLKRYRKWVIGAAVLVGALLLVSVVVSARGRRQAAVTAQTRSEVIGSGPIEIWVTGTGQLEPAALASLSFRVPGTVGSVHVEVGDVVRSGDPLLELDPSSLDPSLIGAVADLVQAKDGLRTLLDGPSAAQVAEAELALAHARDAAYRSENRRSFQQEGRRATGDTIAAARANLILAQEAVDHAKGAYDNLSELSQDDPQRATALSVLDRARRARDSALSIYNWYTGKPTEIDQAILDAEVAVAQADVIEAQKTLDELRNAPDPDDVAVAEARVQAAQASVDQIRLSAPLDATVVAIQYESGDSVTPGQVAVVLADLSRLHVDTLVDELDIASIQPGTSVTLTFDALPGVTLEGSVERIDLVPSTGETTSYPVRVRLTDTDQEVRLGMTAAVNILIAHKDSVLLVPNWALGVDATTGVIHVQVRRGSVLLTTPIELGLRGETESEVLSGLQAGDVVEASAAPADTGPSGPFGGGG
jgi:HlyD family secretion protein